MRLIGFLRLGLVEVLVDAHQALRVAPDGSIVIEVKEVSQALVSANCRFLVLQSIHIWQG
jgi:hypothetical protein